MPENYSIPSWRAVQTVLEVTPNYIFYLTACAYAIAVFVPIRWWLRVIGVLAISIALAQQLHDALLLDQGVCLSQGRKLSEQEMIDGAVREILRAYPPNIIKYGENRVPTGEVVSYGMTKPKNPINYKNTAEFYAINPGCCEFKLALSFEEGIDAYARIRDEYSGFVKAHFLVRYLDDKGVHQEVPFKWEMPVSHCATVAPTQRLFFTQ